jgi:CubicO group peptidase (beta-lactamase class C family)
MKLSKNTLLLTFLTALTFGTSLSLHGIFGWFRNPQPTRPRHIPQGDYTYAKQSLTWFINKKMREHNIKGMSIALVDDQDIVWASGFGLADVEKEIPVTRETIFQIGSTSKLFTALAVMQLHDRGQINIDDPITRYIPEFAIQSHDQNIAPITVRNLLTHHSVLSDSLFVQDVTKYIPPAQISLDTVIEKLNHDFLAIPPNLAFRYSNVGFSLLAALVEHVTGKNFSDYVDENICSPLGMTKSSFTLKEESRPLFAAGYMNDGVNFGWPGIDYPDGFMYSNVMELSIFMRMFLNNGTYNGKQIISPQTLNDMLSRQNKDIPLDFDFVRGLGWWINYDFKKLNIGDIFYHGGFNAGFHSMLAIVLQHKIGVVIQTNTSKDDAEIQDKAVEPIAQEALRLLYEIKVGRSHEPKPIPPIPPVTTIPAKELAKHVGTYFGYFGLATIKLENGRLLLNIEDDKEYILIPHENDLFYAKEPIFFGLLKRTPKNNIPFHLQTVSERKIISVPNDGVEMLFASEIEVKPVPERWKQRVGTYTIENLAPYDDAPNSVEISFDEETQKLELSYIHPLIKSDISSVLNPIDDAAAIIMDNDNTIGGNTIYAVQEDTIEYLWFSGSKLKKKEE